MHYHFSIKFRDSPQLLIQFEDSQLAKDYMALFYRNYQRELPMLRDQGAYDIDRMKDLASQAQSILGWHWTYEDYDDYAVTTQMHKDLEIYLQKGFVGVSEAHDELLHELHICLHSMQLQNQRTTIQLEWFNDDGFDLADYDFEFRHDHTLGAVTLQNPYVGHPPDWIWRQNDHTAVWQTCRFHDWVRPGLVIAMQGNLQRTVTEFQDLDRYLAWWHQWAPDFLEFHGQEKMIRNTGRPVIGYVINNQDLVPLQHQPRLIFESVSFHPDLEAQLENWHLVEIPPITEHDYNNLAGPDWPAYQLFIDGQDRPDFVCREILEMTGIDTASKTSGGTP